MTCKYFNRAKPYLINEIPGPTLATKPGCMQNREDDPSFFGFFTLDTLGECEKANPTGPCPIWQEKFPNRLDPAFH